MELQRNSKERKWLKILLEQMKKEEKKTQAWVAKQAGIEPSYLTQIIKGVKNPAREIVTKLSQPLNLTETEALVRFGYLPEGCIPDKTDGGDLIIRTPDSARINITPLRQLEETYQEALNFANKIRELNSSESQSVEAEYDGEQNLRLRAPLSLEAGARVRVRLEPLLPIAESEHPTSFLQAARSLCLEGPEDWSVNLDRYLYGDTHEPNS